MNKCNSLYPWYSVSLRKMTIIRCNDMNNFYTLVKTFLCQMHTLLFIAPLASIWFCCYILDISQLSWYTCNIRVYYGKCGYVHWYYNSWSVLSVFDKKPDLHSLSIVLLLSILRILTCLKDLSFAINFLQLASRFLMIFGRFIQFLVRFILSTILQE